MKRHIKVKYPNKFKLKIYMWLCPSWNKCTQGSLNGKLLDFPYWWCKKCPLVLFDELNRCIEKVKVPFMERHK